MIYKTLTKSLFHSFLKYIILFSLFHDSICCFRIPQTASLRHIGSLATRCQYPDTTPCSRNSESICTQDEQAATPYGTSRTAPERLSCPPRNASSATFSYE